MLTKQVKWRGFSRLAGTMSPLVVAFLALAIALAAKPALAQEKAADYLEPRVSRTEFAQFLQRLDMPRDTREIAEMAFDDYNDALDTLIKGVDEQALAAGRQSVQDALSGKSRLAPDELRRLRVAVLQVYSQAWPSVDKSLQDLEFSIESMLPAESSGIFQAALRALHRDIYLHPRQESSDFQEYAGDGVDVLALFRDATAETGELQNIPADSVQISLDAYELQLDALLTETAAGYRQTKLNRKVASIMKDIAAQKQEDAAALDFWKRLYELNLNTVQQIGEIASNIVSPDAKQQWLDRFDQASFTWLFPRKKPDRQIEWIRKQSDKVSPETLQKAEAAYQGYLAGRRELSRKAIDVMLRARLEFQTMLYSMMDPTGMDDRVRRGLYEDLLKNTGEQTNLENSTAATLESLLPESLRQDLRNAMKGPDPGARRR